VSAAPPLVGTDWLAAHLNEPNLRVADASWYLPAAGRHARAEYEAAHIPGAVFFDIDAISDAKTDLPHMMPDPAAFASSMKKLGIGDGDTVVFYDGAGLYSSPRALWMMLAMGHKKAAVLDGGLPKWRREGRAIDSASPRIPQRHFIARPDAKTLRDFAAMTANLASRAEQVVDARSPARFRGEEQEPRANVKPGHIPGSANVYYSEVVAPDGTLRSPDELRRIFERHGVDLEKPIVTSCGSGVTAAILSLALSVAGAKRTALYDGSWSEWGARADAPIETGSSGTDPSR
jgi:thiosulfate/3-mercaptopyruvate sulfurtransferase